MKVSTGFFLRDSTCTLAYCFFSYFLAFASFSSNHRFTLYHNLVSSSALSIISFAHLFLSGVLLRQGHLKWSFTTCSAHLVRTVVLNSQAHLKLRIFSSRWNTCFSFTALNIFSLIMRVYLADNQLLLILIIIFIDKIKGLNGLLFTNTFKHNILQRSSAHCGSSFDFNFLLSKKISFILWPAIRRLDLVNMLTLSFI